MNQVDEQSLAEPLSWGVLFCIVVVVAPFVMVFGSGTDVDQSPLFLILVAPATGGASLLLGTLLSVLLRDRTRLSRFGRSSILLATLVVTAALLSSSWFWRALGFLLETVGKILRLEAE